MFTNLVCTQSPVNWLAFPIPNLHSLTRHPRRNPRPAHADLNTAIAGSMLILGLTTAQTVRGNKIRSPVPKTEHSVVLVLSLVLY